METQHHSKGWNITLWIFQSLFALLFLMSGIMKLIMSAEQYHAMGPMAENISMGFVRFIGVAEVLGALGLILPSLLRINPRLTVWAAYGLLIVMISAVIFHIKIGDTKSIGGPVIFAVILALIAWGRTKKAVIAPKIREQSLN
jgi:putative oxidoreductase